MSIRKLICITCPIGCQLEVEMNGINYFVRGNMCKRGEKYGIEEITNPTRMVTSTVKIEGAYLPRIPIKTTQPIPKDKIFECMKLLNDVKLCAPIKCGDKIIDNLFGLNIDVVASRSLDKIS